MALNELLSELRQNGHPRARLEGATEDGALSEALLCGVVGPLDQVMSDARRAQKGVTLHVDDGRIIVRHDSSPAPALAPRVGFLIAGWAACAVVLLAAMITHGRGTYTRLQGLL